jgi:peptidoglycan hydrolase-like protein with peptidoglycan-binding domain
MWTSTPVRRARRTAVALSIAVVSCPVGAGLAAAAPVPVPAGWQAVDFHGYRATVPAGWPVIDLTRQPAACVRYDRPAVYLGHPGSRQDCPAHLVGRTDTLLVEPLDRVAAARVDSSTATAAPGRAAPAGTPVSRDGQLTLAVPAAGVLVTATHGADQTMVRGILAGAELTRGGPPPVAAPLPRPSWSTLAVSSQPGTFKGRGFDACTAPSASQMQAWLSSPYRAVGVYIGGVSRACSQPNLTASWVSTQVAAGWHLISIHVGLQAPCTGFSNRISTDPATATSQGRSAASDAVSKAQALGIPQGSVLYNDMEGYDNTNTTCRTAVLSFLSGWTQRLHEQFYGSGVYSSVSSGIRDLASVYSSTSRARPDHIWFAWWNGVADTNGGSFFASKYWVNHERLHQYAGGHNETWGGVTINIDNDYLDVAPPVNRDFSAYPTVQSGSTGAAVTAAQYVLNDEGYGPIAVDGQFGAQTQSAVVAFQTAKGLTADGVVGAHTWTALLSAGYRPVLAAGSTGLDVKRLQRALTAALARTVTIDGSFGSLTDQAVRDYQSSRGLAVDGTAGNATWSALQAGR